MKAKQITLVVAIALMAVFTSFESKAQANWEVGFRFGDNISVDATIPLGMRPRLQADVYFNRFGIGTYFDWMFALSGGPQGLKFYPGVGPEFWFENNFDLDIAGNFGAEYAFDFPLTIGFDWRPAFRLTDAFSFDAARWGFMARFRFGEGVKFKKVQ